MSPDLSFVLLEWRRICASLGIAVGILILLYAGSHLWLPGGDASAAVTLFIATPLLLVPALFESLASDCEERPFLLGLPYPPARLWGLRLLLRCAILLPVLAVFHFTVFAPMEPQSNWNLFGLSLSGNLLVASMFVFFAPMCRGMSLLMSVLLGLLILCPAQLPAFAAAGAWSHLEFPMIFFPLLQLIVLLAAGGYQLWKRRMMNRPCRGCLLFWCVMAVAIPWLEWGGTAAVAGFERASAQEEAKAAGIVLLDTVWEPGDFRQFSDSDVKAYLAQFGYSPGDEPFYCSALSMYSRQREVSRFVRGAVSPRLLAAYRAGDIGKIREAVNMEVFGGTAALDGILYGGTHEAALEAVIGMLERAGVSGPARRYSVSLRDMWWEIQPASGWGWRLLSMPYRYLMEARILRRESAAFRDVDRISTMDSRTLNLHIARSGDGALFYRLVQEYRVRQGWFLLYAEALKLKLAQHRTGEFPETLETGLPFRYERTKDGFRFTDSRNREVLAYPALKHTEPAEGR